MPRSRRIMSTTVPTAGGAVIARDVRAASSCTRSQALLHQPYGGGEVVGERPVGAVLAELGGSGVEDLAQRPGLRHPVGVHAQRADGGQQLAAEDDGRELDDLLAAPRGLGGEAGVLLEAEG